MYIPSIHGHHKISKQIVFNSSPDEIKFSFQKIKEYDFSVRAWKGLTSEIEFNTSGHEVKYFLTVQNLDSQRSQFFKIPLSPCIWKTFVMKCFESALQLKKWFYLYTFSPATSSACFAWLVIIFILAMVNRLYVNKRRYNLVREVILSIKPICWI